MAYKKAPEQLKLCLTYFLSQFLIFAPDFRVLNAVHQFFELKIYLLTGRYYVSPKCLDPFFLSQYLTNLMHKICFTISFISCLYMFRAHVFIIRRSKLHYTASGIIAPIKLVKYWDKYTEMHGQQNVKKSRPSATFPVVKRAGGWNIVLLFEVWTYIKRENSVQLRHQPSYTLIATPTTFSTFLMLPLSATSFVCVCVCVCVCVWMVRW